MIKQNKVKEVFVGSTKALKVNRLPTRSYLFTDLKNKSNKSLRP